jgi:hypothetical protein
MFQAVIRRAQDAVDRTIDQAINRTVMLVPFVIAGGFGTAALTYLLNDAFGPQVGYLLMAALFVIIGLITMAVAHSRPTSSIPDDAEPQPAEAAPAAAEHASAMALGDTDRELLVAALTSIAPVAMPEVLRLMVKNLPLLAVLGGALFVVTRPSGQSASNSGVSPEAASA